MRKLAVALAALLLAGLVVVVPASALPAAAATGPRVAIIVGATGGTTATYRTYADQLYAEATKYTSNVVRVYSPNATWSRVKSAVNGASIIVYLGHGNGWPSPYTYDPQYTTKDGFGLNYDLNGDGKLSDSENKYYGEPRIETLTPAPNAVVLLFHLCYASGNSESGDPNPSLSVARQRVDNYASAFLRAGARAVIANGHSHDPYYIRALFTTHQTIEQYWRKAPDFNDDVTGYASSRSSGYTYLMDPEAPGRYYRSITGKMSLRTDDVTGAGYAATSGDPATFVVPGNASPVADGAPVYDSAASAAAGADPATTLPASTQVRILGQDIEPAATGVPVFQVRTDDGVEGWMLSSSLVPRDSAAPRLWEVTDGTGAFSPNGDGSQDTFPISLRLSESAAWTLRIVNGYGTQKQSWSGTGDTASATWSPAPGSITDGTFTWVLSATDAWSNGPLAAEGPIAVDTRAPAVTVTAPGADSVPQLTPNGDGSRDATRFTVGSSEPGSVVGSVKNASGTTVATLSANVGGSATTVTWDGRRTSGAYAADGRYDVAFVAVDRAGNAGDAVARSVDVYGALGFVASSKIAFFPQDHDSLSTTTALSFRLLRDATVTWTITDLAGHVVRTLRSDEALAAGSYAFRWNGRDADGAFVRRGSYVSQVVATNGSQTVTQSATVVADAFRLTSSDTTPARGQRITVRATSAEPLSTRPRLVVSQPGIRSWSVAMTKVGTNAYKATITLRSSGTGSLRLKVVARDSHGATQYTKRYLRLH